MTKTLTVYSKNNCAYCVQAKNYLQLHAVPYQEINIDDDAAAAEFLLQQGHRTVPQIYLEGQLFVPGGWQGLSKIQRDELQQRIAISNTIDLGTL